MRAGGIGSGGVEERERTGDGLVIVQAGPEAQPAMSAQLFRKEALQHRTDRLHGSVVIATPLAWQLISLLLLAALVATIIFLSAASYARVEVVTGEIGLDKGVAAIVPTRAGVVETVLVAEGDNVKAGERLVLVRADESVLDGRGASQQTRDALDRQDEQLADQGQLLLAASEAEQRRLSAQIDGDIATIASLEAQIVDQRELIATAQTDYDLAKEVATRGYISKRDIEQRRATILQRRQQLAQLQQSVLGKRADIAQARRAIVQTAMAAKAQAAGTQSSRASVTQQQVQTDLAQGYALIAPTAGLVTGLTARSGQAVTPDQQLMMVIPPQARLRVELYSPTNAIGFIRQGQEVRLSIDAFDYHVFGTVEARVSSVSRAPVVRPGPNGPTRVYLVTAAIDRPWVTAFGRRQPLLPGMTLSARIVTDKRSLIEWLFEPLFAIGRR